MASNNEEINRKFQGYVGEEKIRFVTFHPSFSYEEFVEGMRARSIDDGKSVVYEVQDGIFKEMCKRAFESLCKSAGVKKNWEAFKKDGILSEEERNSIKALKEDHYQRFVLIIDEINRGNISKILGELITLLEPDKRLFSEREIIVTLPYSKEKFGVPPNLYIIGTMNTADRSLALIDVALRRRFAFEEFWPGRYLEGYWKEWWEKPEAIPGEKKFLRQCIAAIKRINSRILGNEHDIRLSNAKDKLIGHSFVMRKDGSLDAEDVLGIWKYEILPLLEEYYSGNYDKIKTLLGDKAFNLAFDGNSPKKLDVKNIEEFLAAIVGS